MAEQQNAKSPQYHRVHIGVRFSTLRFPLDPRELAFRLPENGWIVPPALMELPLGGNVGGSGLIARRGSSQVLWNTDAQVLAVSGREPEKVAEDFLELDTVVKTDIDYDIAAHAMFYELIAEALVPSNRNTLDAMRSMGSTLELPAMFEKAVGRTPALFGLRLCAGTGYPDEAEWYDLDVMPLIARPEKYYYMRAVWRSKARDTVLDVTRDLTNVFTGLVTSLEGRLAKDG